MPNFYFFAVLLWLTTKPLKEHYACDVSMARSVLEGFDKIDYTLFFP